MSLEKQEVLVTGTIPYDDLLEKIKKTGKTVRGFLLELRSISVARCLDGIIFGCVMSIGPLWGDAVLDTC